MNNFEVYLISVQLVWATLTTINLSLQAAPCTGQLSGRVLTQRVKSLQFNPLPQHPVIETVMQWRLGAARHTQALFLLSHMLDASLHFLADFLVISAHILHLNFTDFFEDKGYALDPNNSLQTLSIPFPFPLPLGTLHQDAHRTCKRFVTNASSKEEPRHFLIYHYITVWR